MVAEERIEDAERLAHSLKGLSGTLEAQEIFLVATQLETVLHEGGLQDVDSLIAILETHLADAIKAIATLDPPSPQQILPMKTPPQATLEPFVAPLADLRRLIVGNSLKARKEFAALKGRLDGHGNDADVERLGLALERLEFSEALEILDRLAKSQNL